MMFYLSLKCITQSILSLEFSNLLNKKELVLWGVRVVMGAKIVQVMALVVEQSGRAGQTLN